MAGGWKRFRRELEVEDFELVGGGAGGRVLVEEEGQGCVLRRRGSCRGMPPTWGWAIVPSEAPPRRFFRQVWSNSC